MFPQDGFESTAAPALSPRERLAALLLAVGRAFAKYDFPIADRQARALVFAPHPDDEVLGCGGTIALKAASGADVRVVVMTDGRASHASMMAAPELARMRREEALRAAVRLGLAPGDYKFLDFEDHRLHECKPAATDRVHALLDEFCPEQVFLPHRRDRLSDHVATSEIVRDAAQAHGRPLTLFEYPVWLWHTWPWTIGKPEPRAVLAMLRRARDIVALVAGCRRRVDVRAYLSHKRAALAEYRSQVERHEAMPNWPVLADVAEGAFVDCLMGPEESFRVTRSGRYLPIGIHPHDGST